MKQISIIHQSAENHQGQKILNALLSIPARESYWSQNKIFIRGASPGRSDAVRDKNAIGGLRWDAANRERKVRNMEIEIVTLVVKGSAKLTVPTDWQEQIHVESTSVALHRIFDLKIRGIRLTDIILKVWVIYGRYVIDYLILRENE